MSGDRRPAKKVTLPNPLLPARLLPAEVGWRLIWDEQRGEYLAVISTGKDSITEAARLADAAPSMDRLLTERAELRARLAVLIDAIHSGRGKLPAKHPAERRLRVAIAAALAALDVDSPHSSGSPEVAQ